MAPSSEGAFDIAEAYAGEGYILMNELSDNPGSGDPREIYNAVTRPIYPLDDM